MNHADINIDFFRNRINSLMRINKDARWDVFLGNTETSNKLQILVNNGKYNVKAGELLSNSGKLIGKEVVINKESKEIETKNGTTTITTRYNDSHNKMYDIPNNAKFFIDEQSGNEIILIDSMNDLKMFVNKASDSFNMVDVNNAFEISDN